MIYYTPTEKTKTRDSEKLSDLFKCTQRACGSQPSDAAPPSCKGLL